MDKNVRLIVKCFISLIERQSDSHDQSVAEVITYYSNNLQSSWDCPNFLQISCCVITKYFHEITQ